jgi:cyclophilin family peptidyl-prolyl cis-trans isomerase/HEAT repeat protein
VRAKAALAAGRLRDPAAGPYLAALLRDTEAPVRRAAAFASGISGDPHLVKPLAVSLTDPDDGTATQAAEALGRLGGDEATAALLSVLDGETAPRSAAARALFRAPDPARAARLASLALSDDLPLRRACVYALARKPIPAALPALRRSLADPDARIAALCARGVGILDDRDSIPSLVRLASGPDSSAAIQALLAFRTFGRKAPVPEEACVAARARVSDRNAGISTTALGALAGCRDEASTALLHAAVASGGPRGEEALGALVAHGLTSLPAEAALSGSLELRLGAADAIGRLPREAAVSLAAKLLRDDAPRVRAAAVSALPGDAPRELLERALGDRDAAVRAAALEKGAPRRDELPAAWDAAYAACLRETEPDFTVTALEAAAALPKGGAELLKARVNDQDAVVRATARRLLIAKKGARREDFAEVPIATRHGFRDYERIARQANETAFTAEIATERGSFTIALDAESAPITVETFLELSRRSFFDGTVIHRVVPDFVVQAGDPRGDGSGGPGFAIRDELNPLPYERGTVGMALSGPDTGGSQFFVALSPQPHLEGSYTVFGKVVGDDAVLDRIEKDDRLVTFRVREAHREPPRGFVR